MPNGPPTFEELLEAAPDAMLGTDAAGLVVFANERAKALLGRDPVGRAARRAARRRWTSRAARWASTSSSSCATPTRARLRAVLDNTPAAIFLKDPDGRYLLVNRAFEKLHGRPVAELLGKLDREVLPPEVAERMRIDDLRVMGEREPIELQEEVTHGDQTRTFLSVKFPLIDENDGELYGIGGVATDITHHVRLEARLREAQRLEAVGQLAGGVAHDFNNLLAVIANYAQFVRKELEDGSRAAGDMEQIISRVAPRLGAHAAAAAVLPPAVRHARGPVAAAGDRVLGAAAAPHARRRDRPRRRLRRARLGRRGRPRPARAARHEPRHNSREAMPDGGTLRIEVANTVMRDPDGPSARAVKLTVIDTGRGMAKEVAAHAFEPFFTTKAVSGHGVGLGLATVYGIVTKARGRIELESAPGEGTTVTVTLPAVRRATDDEPSPSAPRGRGETVLVVEDADAVRVLTGRILYSAGYQVISVESGATALERLDACDVLVTDVVMPGMSRRRAGRRGARAPAGAAGDLRVGLHGRRDASPARTTR